MFLNLPFAGNTALPMARVTEPKRTSTPVKGSAWRAARVESGQDVSLLQALVSILNEGKAVSILDEYRLRHGMGKQRVFNKSVSMRPMLR